MFPFDPQSLSIPQSSFSVPSLPYTLPPLLSSLSPSTPYSSQSPKVPRFSLLVCFNFSFRCLHFPLCCLNIPNHCSLSPSLCPSFSHVHPLISLSLLHNIFLSPPNPTSSLSALQDGCLRLGHSMTLLCPCFSRDPCCSNSRDLGAETNETFLKILI